MPPEDFAKFIDRARQFQLKHHAVWTMDISNLKISIDCTSAVTTLSLHNVEDAPSAPTHPAYDETFLESFWLSKTPDGLWKIAFWHSTKMPKSAPGSEKRK